MKITRNPHKIAITEEMIPIVVGNDEIRMVRVTVDGCSASCFLHDRVWYTTKVVIVFDQEHDAGEITSQQSTSCSMNLGKCIGGIWVNSWKSKPLC